MHLFLEHAGQFALQQCSYSNAVSTGGKRYRVSTGIQSSYYSGCHQQENVPWFYYTYVNYVYLVILNTDFK